MPDREPHPDLHPLIRRRFSALAFDPERPVPPAHQHLLLEAANWAPSSYGDQPWRFILCDRHRDRPAWDAALACLMEGNRAWAQSAPLFILACAFERLSHSGQPNRWAQYDTGAAVENLCLQAIALDLATRQMGGFHLDLTRERFAVPEEVTPMAFVAVGHPADPASLPEDLRRRALAPRARAPLGERVFRGRWGTPWSPTGS